MYIHNNHFEVNTQSRGAKINLFSTICELLYFKQQGLQNSNYKLCKTGTNLSEYFDTPDIANAQTNFLE